ncbi:MAG TPA: hypothetical protein VFK02_09560, partial [Kofleriaceae bacterium]|nr:hypothetical protein [Kofleriaceae bacterium]
MSEEQIRIGREELFDPAVDKALARERQGRERIIADTPPVSPVRRLLFNSMFYLPLAAVLAAFVAWRVLDPRMVDTPTVSGEIMLVNTDPFDGHDGVVALTVGSNEILVNTSRVVLEPGAHGEPRFASADALKVGDRIEVTGIEDGRRLMAIAIRPTDSAEPRGEVVKPAWPFRVLFPFTAMLIALGLLLAEGLTTRNWIRMIERSLLGSFLAALFAVLAFFPAGAIWQISDAVLNAEVRSHPDLLFVTVKEISGVSFILFIACRSAAWACIGAATGLGMNLVRSTRTQLRNSVIGGALGGALGGLFFDPIDRFFGSSLFTGSGTSRMVGLLAVGLSIGLFVALVERLARDAWLRVRTGPLAGKSFILYKTPTIIGNT